jgi:uncharacterized membrane protein HdeD (DUF308 family)
MWIYSKEMSAWVRAAFILVGVLSVIISIVTLIRPRLDLEIILLPIPCFMLINGIGWIAHGVAGR